DVAAHAELRTLLRALDLAQAVREVVRVSDARGIVMRCEPRLRTTVAGLAADAVGHLESLASVRRRRRVGVASEALGRLVRVLQAETTRDLHPAFFAEHAIRVGVRIEARPDHVLILSHAARGE